LTVNQQAMITFNPLWPLCRELGDASKRKTIAFGKQLLEAGIIKKISLTV